MKEKQHDDDGSMSEDSDNSSDNNEDRKRHTENGKDGNNPQIPPGLTLTSRYNDYKWQIRGHKDFFSAFPLKFFLEKVKQFSPGTIWYPTKQQMYPPVGPVHDLKRDLPKIGKTFRYWNCKEFGEEGSIEFHAHTKYNLLDMRKRLTNFLSDKVIYIDSDFVKIKVLDNAGFVFGFQERSHYLHLYK